MAEVGGNGVPVWDTEALRVTSRILWPSWDLNPGLSEEWILPMGFSAARFPKMPQGRESGAGAAAAAPPREKWGRGGAGFLPQGWS